MSTLKSLCLDSVSRNLDNIFETVDDDEGGRVMRLPGNQPFFFPSGVAEPLLTLLGLSDRLTDAVMSLFTADTAALEAVDVADARMLTPRGLAYLLERHNIKELRVSEVCHEQVTPSDLVSSLSEWSVRNLFLLDVGMISYGTYGDTTLSEQLIRLNKLKVLNLRFVLDFDNASLALVVSSLTKLESIDISLTGVDDVGCLLVAKDRLRSLSVHGIGFPEDSLVTVLSQLKELRHLDLSHTEGVDVGSLLLHVFPHLQSLDISGISSSTFPRERLRTFVRAHPGLSFLGILHVNGCQDLCKDFEADEFPLLNVAGSSSVGQMVTAIQRYGRRRTLLISALYVLKLKAMDLTVVRPDLVRLLLTVARKCYVNDREVMQEVLECLAVITMNAAILSELSLELLGEVAKLALYTMRKSYFCYDIVDTACEIMDRDRILREVDFDRFQFVHRAFVILGEQIKDEDEYPFTAFPLIHSCSILAGEFSSIKKSKLATTANLRSLLDLVVSILQKEEDRKYETLAFTFSILGSLTNGNSEACLVFKEVGGIQVCRQAVILMRQEEEEEDGHRDYMDELLLLLEGLEQEESLKEDIEKLLSVD